MRYHVLSLVALMFVAMFVAIFIVPRANADVCYFIFEQGYSCDPNQYYCSEYYRDICILGGCQGPYCNTGYGYCCGHQYATDVVWGDGSHCGSDCLGGQRLFGKDLAIDRQFHKQEPASSARYKVVPVVAYYVPSRCNLLFGISDPAEVYGSSPGM